MLGGDADVSEDRKRSIRNNLQRFVKRESGKDGRLSRVDSGAERTVTQAPLGGTINASDAGKFILDISKLDGSDVLG